MKKTVWIVFVTVFFFSCATNAHKERFADTSMFVMIYDYDNSGVANVDVFNNDEYIGSSDIQGRFIIDEKIGETYTLRFEKNEYESVELDVVYDPFSVLYIKMGNANQFVRLCENELDAYNYEEALEYVNKALEIQHERIDAKYLKAIILFKQGKFDEVEAELYALTAKVGEQEYVRLLLEKNTKAKEAANEKN